MKYDKERFNAATNDEKMNAIKKELSLVTHNGTSKADLLMMLEYLVSRLEKSNGT